MNTKQQVMDAVSVFITQLARINGSDGKPIDVAVFLIDGKYPLEPIIISTIDVNKIKAGVDATLSEEKGREPHFCVVQGTPEGVVVESLDASKDNLQ